MYFTVLVDELQSHFRHEKCVSREKITEVEVNLSCSRRRAHTP